MNGKPTYEELEKRVQELDERCARLETEIADQARDLEELVVELVEAIEEQKKAEAELRESEERFRQIAESINSVFWIRDQSAGRLLYVSPAYEIIWGRTCESLYQHPQSWMEAVHPRDRDRVRRNSFLSHDPAQDPAKSVEFRIIRRDGDIRWIRARMFEVGGPVCRHHRLIGIAEDITDYMEMLDGLRESEARYRMLFESSIDGIGIYACGSAGGGQRLIDCNASFLHSAGRGKAELLDLADIRAIKRFYVRTRGREGRSPSLGLLGDRQCTGLYSWVRPDGQQNFIECRGRMLPRNGIEYMHCVHRDVTRAKLAEEEIRRLSRRMVEVVEEEQKRIAADLHDEFGQRLLSMRYKIDGLQKKLTFLGNQNLPELAEIDEMVDTVGAAVRRAINRLRPDVLDTLGFLPALEWGIRDFSERNPLVRVSMETLGARRLLPPDFEIALYRVFQEALTNIAKHSAADTVSVRLIFCYPSFILILSDNGQGFNEDALPVPPLQKHGRIGLRSMRERMLAIGGKLSVCSRRGKGTVLRAEVSVGKAPEESGSGGISGGTNHAELHHER